MISDSLLAGVMLFSSFAVRTPNVQPNPDDYEVSIGLTNKNFHINRQWERELGEFYTDDLFWAKLEGGRVYFKPEYMNKESHDVRYFKMDWRKQWKNITYGFTSRNDDEDVFSQNFETFFSFGMSKKKTYWERVDVEVSFDGYMPPDDTGENTTFEYEDKFKVSWKLTDKVRLYNVGEVSKLQGKEFYKGKIGIEVSL
jgi:hypothetical protein|tara:strand:+ start:1609 stop:2202 length:594 start_codon:yes stop_codon:yes gene_type:complete